MGELAGCTEVPDPMRPISITFDSLAPNRTAIRDSDITINGAMFMSRGSPPPRIGPIGLAVGLAAGIGIFISSIWDEGLGDGLAAGIGMFACVCAGEGVGDGLGGGVGEAVGLGPGFIWSWP